MKIIIHIISYNVGNSEKLYTPSTTNTTTTNATGAGDPLSILLDSGFSGGCVCGDVTFREAMSLAPKLARKATELETEPNFYTFGAGDTLRSTGTIRFRTWIGKITIFDGPSIYEEKEGNYQFRKEEHNI